MSHAFSSWYCLEPAVIPTAQASHCSTFRIMCDVPSIAVFCSESIECLPGTTSKFFLNLLVTIPLAPIVTGIIVHFRFHIRCISVHKLLYFNFFVIIEFLTSQLWLGNIHLSWDVLINRIRLGGLIYSLKSFLQLNMCQDLQFIQLSR